MDDVWVVDRDVAGVELQIHSVRLVDMVGMDADTEDELLLVEVDQVATFEQGVVLRSGKDTHASVFDGRWCSGNPKRRDFHRFQRPVGSVLMPLNGAARLRGLGDIVRGEERDVGADELLCDVEQAIVADQAVHKRIVHEHVMVILLGARVRMPFLQPLDVVDHFGGEIGVDGLPGDAIALFVVFFAEIGHWQVKVQNGKCKT